MSDNDWKYFSRYTSGSLVNSGITGTPTGNPKRWATTRRSVNESTPKAVDVTTGPLQGGEKQQDPIQDGKVTTGGKQQQQE